MPSHHQSAPQPRPQAPTAVPAIVMPGPASQPSQQPRWIMMDNSASRVRSWETARLDPLHLLIQQGERCRTSPVSLWHQYAARPSEYSQQVTQGENTKKRGEGLYKQEIPSSNKLVCSKPAPEPVSSATTSEQLASVQTVSLEKVNPQSLPLCPVVPGTAHAINAPGQTTPSVQE